jgi:hypothetical protein
MRTDPLGKRGLDGDARALAEKLEADGVNVRVVFVAAIDGEGNVSTADNFCCAGHRLEFLQFVATEILAGRSVTTVSGETVQ